MLLGDDFDVHKLNKMYAMRAESSSSNQRAPSKFKWRGDERPSRRFAT